MVYREFLKEFTKFSAEALAWAFREHRRRSPYFPAMSEVFQLLGERRAAERSKREAERRKREAKEVDQARRDGKLVDFAELRAKLHQLANAKGIPEPVRRLREYELRTCRVPMIPAVQMTLEEIAARRDRDRAEIESYREREVGR